MCVEKIGDTTSIKPKPLLWKIAVMQKQPNMKIGRKVLEYRKSYNIIEEDALFFPWTGFFIGAEKLTMRNCPVDSPIRVYNPP